MKQCLVKTAEALCPDKVNLFKDIPLTRNTVADRTDEMLSDLKQQLTDRASKFEYFSIAIDETVDITGTEQLAVFIRASNLDFPVYEELAEFASHV